MKLKTILNTFAFLLAMSGCVSIGLGKGSWFTAFLLAAVITGMVADTK